MMEEKPPNDRVVGREYGVAGKSQLEEIKAVRAAAALEDYYYPPGATEPVPIKEE
jgi:hypothetical protein